MEYRVLARHELDGVARIDRTETIERMYYMREGELVLEDEHWDVPDWSPKQKQEQIAEVTASYDKGATVFGACDGEAIVGVAVLEHAPLGTGDARLNLAGLWVSHAYRTKGVGRTLCGLAEQEARRRGAKALYASATPSENTVRFYRTLGFGPARPIDPGLFEKEPEDIHLELILR